MADKFERFHIDVANAPLPERIPRIFVERKDICVGCGICTTACVYGVHNRMPSALDFTKISEPDHSLCVNCHRCVNECPVGALELHAHPDFLSLGDSYYTPDLIQTLTKEAETGRVPVSGQGYRGPFAGPGFDQIWTDMSEIVRPTRDGIHGREYISTQVEIGRKPQRLEFSGPDLKSEPFVQFRVPIPLFLRLPAKNAGRDLSDILARAASEIGNLAFLPLEFVSPEFASHTAAMLSGEEKAEDLSPVLNCPLVEFENHPNALGFFKKLKGINPKWVVSISLPLSLKAPERVLELVRGGAEVVHLYADRYGRAQGEDGRKLFLIEPLLEVENALVENGLRDQVTLLVSGGIARAEHVPKAMICGADAVGVGDALLYALGFNLAGEKQVRDPDKAVQRIKNLLNAWRDQLLEVMGAMGIREARRLQGETGRAMFYKDLEEEFKDVFGKPASPSPAPQPETVFQGIPESAKVIPTESKIWRKISKYNVSYTKDCIDCGLCMLACPYGVHEKEPAKLRMKTPASEACIGPVCETRHPAPLKESMGKGYCVPRCPFDAIKIEKNPEWETLGDPRWTGDLLFSTWFQAETGKTPSHGDWSYAMGASGGGFDRIEFKIKEKNHGPLEEDLLKIDTSIELNRRSFGPRVSIPVPWYGGGMSYGSVGLSTMISRARAAMAWKTFTSTGEGGYPDELWPYRDWIVTQVATGMFGVREETIGASKFVEIKYAQGAKPGLGGHLLSDKNTATVAALRETVPGISLFSPFPFHSVYSVEDHRKHVDWLHATADAVRLDLGKVKQKADCDVLVSAKVSTPVDVDMVAVGCYYGGVNIIHLDGSYGGTGAAPDIAKKNIAMPIEYAIPKVHRFLIQEGIRNDVVLIASGGIRTPYDVAKAIALGADGVVLGTSDLVALNCTRCGNCESGRGCQHGIATTDPVLSKLWTDDWGAQRIINMYYSFRMELAALLWRFELKSIRDLRGRTDLLLYCPKEIG